MTVTNPLRYSFNYHDFYGTWVHSDGKERHGKFYLKKMEGRV